jgi:ankyrin repeat protein
MKAAGGGNLEVARLFINKGADVNPKDEYGKTALSHAA